LKGKMKKSFGRVLLFISAVLICLFAVYLNGVSADDETAAAAAAAQEQDAERISSRSITIDFKDADIKTVLRILSEKSGINIVAGKDVEGFITIRLLDVDWEKALDIICKNYGFAYEREENIIRVTTIENLRQEELVTEVFSLNYATASQVSSAISEMLTDRGKNKIKYDERTNVLIVTDIPTNIYKIRRVIEHLDQKTPQVLIEAKIIETTLTDEENLGIDWNLKLSAVGASRPTTFPFSFKGTMPYLGLNNEAWNTYMPRPEGDTSLDIQELGGGVVLVETAESEFPLSLGVVTQAYDSPFPVMGAEDFAFGTLDFSQFSMVLEFLKARRDTSIISNPRVTTLNNKEASIHIGTILAIPTFERNSETGTIEITGYTEKNLGIRLNVTPHINARGDIVVDLKPEVSALLGYDVLDAARGLTAPRFSTREAETQVMLADGKTLMIGGLIREDVINYVDKVPFLGDIPMIGKMLFSKTEENVEKTELIIFLTVHLVGDDFLGAEAASSAAFVPLK